jgi:hypothetical protein
MKSAVTVILLLTTVATASAGTRTVTFFSDGALVELESSAVKGVVEIPLPAGMREGTLRIRPLEGAVIQRVERLPLRRGAQEERELEALAEQRNRLEDRLKALATREEIFTAAAKSQSGKAPRKTKSNPDPMKSIRQGTDFAIAQLEAVYTSRRRTEQEIRHIDGRIVAVKKGGSGEAHVVRVTVSPRNGRVKTRFAVSGSNLTPRYDVRLDDSGSARVTLYGQVPASFAGYLLRVSAGSLVDGDTSGSDAPASTPLARVAEYRLPVSEERFGTGVSTAFAFTLKNSAASRLPAGDAALFRNGEYWGAFRFEEISSGRSRRISSGMP